jgi:hypothetical protein
MEAFNGKFKLAVVENKAACMNAWFHGTMSAKDMEIMMSPANVICLEIAVTEKTARMAPTYSMKPEMNYTFEYTIGELVEIGSPYSCKSTVTFCGKGMKEVVSYEDGSTFTYTSTATGQGLTTKVTGPDGYIGTTFFARVEPCLTGFYMMESHENMDKMIAEDANCSLAEATEMCASLAMRITECNGFYTLTDYMGNGAAKIMTFKMGEEFDIDDASLGFKGKEIVTRTAPGQYMFAYKDASGKTSLWEGILTEDLFTFKVTKPLNTVTGSITYRKYPDFTGSFKTMSISGAQGFFDALGMSDYAKDFAADRSTMTTTYLGKGMFQWSTDSKMMDFGPLVWKSGEEFSYTWQGSVCVQVMTPTKEGMEGGTKMGDVVSVFKSTVGKTFIVTEETLVASPGAKMVYISSRV